MTSTTNTLNTVQSLLIREFDLKLEQVRADARLDGLGIDSLATIEFMFLLEETFKLRMPEVPNGVLTVGDIATGVDAARDQSGTAPPA